MARSTKVEIFGIHGVTVMDYFTGLPVGQADVIGELSLPLTAEMESLYGGSHINPVAGEPTIFTADGSLELREFPEVLAEYLAAGVGATVAASATGAVAAITNYYGTSAMSATTGIATATIKSGENAKLKAGVYRVKVVTADTVDVYALNTTDLKKGTAVTIQDDALKITATALTIAMGAAVEIPNTGVELTGGSGIIGMTIGDVATFEVYPPHSGVTTVTIGAAGATFKRVGLMLEAQKRSTGEIVYIECPNALCLGWPLAMPEKGFASGSVSIGVYTHQTLNYSVKMTEIKGTTV